jgi:hypothetical protein
MKKEARVRYVGPTKSGVPEGRIGTLLSEDPEGIGLVDWDPYPNCDCQVTHSGAAMDDLEEVTPIPKCERPTRPGVYVIQVQDSKDLAFVRRDQRGLYVHYGISGMPLDKVSKDAQWWGPLEVK